MRFQIEYFRQFLRDSGGAISVDYVVLAGAVTALTLGSTDIIQSGLRTLAGTVDSEFRGEAGPGYTGASYGNGFDTGSEGWSGASTSEINGIGNVLGPIGSTGGQPGINRDFTIDPDVDRATFSFDLYSMDNFDGDTGTVFVNGQAIGSVTVDNGTPVFTAANDLQERGIIIRYSDIDTNTNLGGNPNENDALSHFEISLINDPDNPIGTVNIGFGSDASASVNNEFFAIDNFQATGLAGGDGSGAGDDGGLAYQDY